MSGAWEANVRRVTPYVPGEQPRARDIVKLNTNENPYPPSPAVQKALAELDWEALRRYPDPSGEPLLSALAESEGLSKEQTFVGVGSDDVLSMAFQTFFSGTKPVLFPDITYSFYEVWASLYRIPFRKIPLDQDFAICPGDYRTENGGIVLANPNAPIGTALPLSAVEEVVRANPGSVVIVDEAYIDFGGETALPLLSGYENVLVVRTFSKSRALAGLRIGYAFGSEKLIRYLNEVKFSVNSYTMNLPALALGTAVLQDRAGFEENLRRVVATRERMKRELTELGFRFPDSQANFLFITHPERDCVELFHALREAGIFVRHFDQPERIRPYLRVTVGTEEEIDRFLDHVREYLHR